jgi:hypothetical protein
MSTSRPAGESPVPPPLLHVAIVHTPDGVRFVAAALTPAALTERLAEYVRQRAAHQLWPDAARVVHDRLAAGALDQAVASYFAAVGDRWDDERLVIEAVPTATAPVAATAAC